MQNELISSSASDSPPDQMGYESNTTASRGSIASQADKDTELLSSARDIQQELGELFAENVGAKIWKVAAAVLEQQVYEYAFNSFLG